MMVEIAYEYSSLDFIESVVGWDKSAHLSRFDNLLRIRWDLAQQAGHFRYKLDGKLETKILDGKYGFIAQLNIKRASERRKPQYIHSISQPFNIDDFNFTKVGEHEVLFQIKKNDVTNASTNCISDVENAKNGIESCHQLIINVSPLEYGNSLFVPFVNFKLPQVLTFESIKMAIELVLCSSDKSFRAGFNSLCAAASVNHHHFHVYYLNYEIPVETVDVKNIIGECYEIINYPAPGFAFQLIDSDLDFLTKLVYTVANFLQLNNVAHNLFITRGNKFNSKSSVYDTVRIYLWARISEYGAKDDTSFNVACCELSGHLPIKQDFSFQTITEDEVASVLSTACTSIFSEVLPKVKLLLSRL